MSNKTHAAARIEEAAQEVRVANAQLDATILVGREAGLTWDEIGQRAGMTRQSAWQHWKFDLRCSPSSSSSSGTGET